MEKNKPENQIDLELDLCFVIYKFCDLGHTIKYVIES